MAGERIYVGDTVLVGVSLSDESNQEIPCKDVSWHFVKPDETSVSLSVAVPAQPVLNEGSAGLLSGTYSYVIANIDDGLQSVTTIPVSISVSSKEVQVIYAAAEVNVTSRNLYRKGATDTSYKLVTSLPITAGTYTDNTPNLSSTEEPHFLYGTGRAKLVDFANTNLAGLYSGTARFLTVDNLYRSVPISWEVIDPIWEMMTDAEKTVEIAWMFLEDCFDSEHGGPWLRDVTLANFSKDKLVDFFDVALFEINTSLPPTNFTEQTFPYDTAAPLLAKGIMIEAIKHLMRSYVEQPLVAGAGQISYFDRRDYYQRWQTILEVEKNDYNRLLALFKRQYYSLGESKILVDTKSGMRLYRQILRTRYPRYRWFYW